MAIRLATGVDPVLAAGLVGGLAVSATGYGLWAHRRFQRRSWSLAWGIVGIGLLFVVAGAIVQAAGQRPELGESSLPVALSLAGDGLTIGGLCLLMWWRTPGRASEALTTVVVAALAVCFALLALVVVPARGWHPAVQLPSMAVPACDLVMVWLTGTLMSMSEKHPVAYRYLLAGFGCLFFSHSLTAALFLGGMGSTVIPLDAVALWGACLWGCAVLHPSQRTAFEPVPLRPSRPSWPHVVLLVAATILAPGILGLRALLGFPVDAAVLAVGSALLPALVVLYLLHQVFTRSAAEYRAQHDALTGVCNRVLFDDSLAAALVDARRRGAGLALMFLDLDRFKSINDSLGHAVGNELLQAVVKRLQSSLRPKDTLARMGGDEFTILFPDVEDKAQAANISERILKVFSEPFNVGGHLLPVQASVGAAMFPEDGEDVEELFKNADTAMYQAKAAGRNTSIVYDATMSARARLRFALESSLRSSLEQGRLAVHYQPKFDTDDASIVGVEALARWNHPRLGMIPPWAFIPLAEETSLIASLGEWVLETACVQAREWQRWAPQGLSVAVNLSPRQFICQPVVEMVERVLERTQLDPRLLELEVTEGVLMEHMEEVAASLAALRTMGIRCSIDDFGTGYSALTYLTDIPVDAIKIDPSFVRRIDSASGAAPIVGAVIGLAHSLDLDVVAEGVETQAQFEFLRMQDCDYVQGFLFSPPVAAEEIERYLRRLAPLPVFGTAGSTAGEEFVLPSARLSSLLAGVARKDGWSQDPDNSDVEAVLAALQVVAASPLVNGRQLGLAPARMAFGTLAGLASLTGGLSAAGVLPKAIAAQVLHQATGIGITQLPAGPGNEGPLQHASNGGSTFYVAGASRSAGVDELTDGPSWPAGSDAGFTEAGAAAAGVSPGDGGLSWSGDTATGGDAPSGGDHNGAGNGIGAPERGSTGGASSNTGGSSVPGDQGSGNSGTGKGNAGDPGTGKGNAGDPGTGNGSAGDPGTGNGNAGDPGTGNSGSDQGKGNSGSDQGNGNAGSDQGNGNAGTPGAGGSSSSGDQGSGNPGTGNGNAGDPGTGNGNAGDPGTGNGNAGDPGTGNSGSDPGNGNAGSDQGNGNAGSDQGNGNAGTPGAGGQGASGGSPGKGR